MTVETIFSGFYSGLFLFLLLNLVSAFMESGKNKFVKMRVVLATFAVAFTFVHGSFIAYVILS